MQRDGPAPPSPNDCITKRSLRHSARKFSHVQAALSSAAGVGPRRGGGSKVHRTRSLKKKKNGDPQCSPPSRRSAATLASHVCHGNATTVGAGGTHYADPKRRTLCMAGYLGTRTMIRLTRLSVNAVTS